MESTSPTLQRTILRLLQTNGQMERSKLGLHSRSTDPDNWASVLDDLVARGLITEDSVIRVGANSYRGQKRAVIVYTLNHNPDAHPKFADMTAEAVHEFVETFPRSDAEAIAS